MFYFLSLLHLTLVGIRALSYPSLMVMTTLLVHGNNMDNFRGDITHRQPISKKISYKPYKRIASFNSYFYKENFLDWLLDLLIYLTTIRIFLMGEKLDLLCINLVSMSSEYALGLWYLFNNF